MGLSSDPEKRQRQLDALAAGRRAGAEKVLGQGSAPASPGSKKATAKPGRSQGRRRASYNDAPAEPRQPTEPLAGETPPAEPEPKRTGLDRLFDGFGR